MGWSKRINNSSHQCAAGNSISPLVIEGKPKSITHSLPWRVKSSLYQRQLCFHFHALMSYMIEIKNPPFLKVLIVSFEAARGVLFITPGGVPILSTHHRTFKIPPLSPIFPPFSLSLSLSLSFQSLRIKIYFSYRPKQLIYCDRRLVSEFQTFF